MDCRLKQGSLLKKVVEGIKELCREVSFDVDEEGISVQAMDSSHVALVSLKLKADSEGLGAFERFCCSRPCSIGVNIEALSRALKLCGNDDSMRIYIQENAQTGEVENQLHLIFETPGGGRISHIDLNLLDLEAEHLGIPDMDYFCTVGVPSADLQRLLRDAKDFGSDAIEVSVDSSRVKFVAKGDIGKTEVCLKPSASPEGEPPSKLARSQGGVTIELAEGDAELKTDGQPGVMQTFALRYLLAFTRASPLSERVCLKLSPERPLVVQFLLEDDERKGLMQFYLAPKVEDE